MKDDSSDENRKLFSKYLSESKILICDQASSGRTGVARALGDLGAKTHQMGLFDSFEGATDFIQKDEPKVVVCEYFLGKKSGFDLIDIHKKKAETKTKEKLFILVTGSSTESTVARAAEEDVDAFVLKPYTINTFRKTIVTSAVTKLFPSEYLKTIDEGKELLLSGQYDAAIQILNKAIQLDSMPTLAMFYRGQAYLMKEALEASQKSYEEGLSVNRIHFKCLVGLFDLLQTQNKPSEAYEVVKKLAQYFPANPKRLAQILRLSIVTGNYSDIEKYYEIFKSIDVRSDELVKYVCSALIVTGRYYLKQSFRTRALELFQKVGVSSAGRTGYLRAVVEALVDADLHDEAMPYLERFPSQGGDNFDFQVSKYLVESKKSEPSKVIEKGRMLVKAEIHHPGVYRILIQRLEDAKIVEQAQLMKEEFRKKFPEAA